MRKIVCSALFLVAVYVSALLWTTAQVGDVKTQANADVASVAAPIAAALATSTPTWGENMFYNWPTVPAPYPSVSCQYTVLQYKYCIQGQWFEFYEWWRTDGNGLYGPSTCQSKWEAVLAKYENLQEFGICPAPFCPNGQSWIPLILCYPPEIAPYMPGLNGRVWVSAKTVYCICNRNYPGSTGYWSCSPADDTNCSDNQSRDSALDHLYVDCTDVPTACIDAACCTTNEIPAYGTYPNFCSCLAPRCESDFGTSCP